MRKLKARTCRNCSAVTLASRGAEPRCGKCGLRLRGPTTTVYKPVRRGRTEAKRNPRPRDIPGQKVWEWGAGHGGLLP